MAPAQTKVPATEVKTEYSDITCNDFPKDFIFGTGTAAYQHEGGATTGGRGISVWDVFTLRTPGNITDGSNGNIAVDMYNKYEDDIKMMKSMGFDAYRFSISWPRILPGGKICLGVNREGIDYYNKLINCLIHHKITPYVTLFHWDLPYTLEQEYEGFLCEDIVKDFREFADLCFWEFGDRVKHWFTFNEPWTYCYRGYVDRNFPPTEVIVAPKADSGYEAAGAGAVTGAANLAHQITGAGAGAVTGAANLAHQITGAGAHAFTGKLSVPAIVPKSLVPVYDSSVSANLAEITQNLLALTQSHEESERIMDICNRAMGKNKKCFNSYRCGNFSAPVEDPTATIASKMMLRASLISGDRKYSQVDNSMPEEDKEAFIAAKYMLLAHAAAVELYKTKYQKHQKGQIGITLVSHWFEPKFNKKQDEEAARRALDFMLGWFLDPVLFGRYPKNMEKYVPREAQFSAEETEMLKKHKIDFLGLNYYTARYVKNVPNPENKYQHAYKKYQFATQYQNKNKKPIGEAPGAKWLNIVPWGIKKLLKKVNELYNNTTYKLPPVFITENGMADVSNHKLTAYNACVDKKRVRYFQDHLGNILDAMKETKMPIKGYFAWSWSDNFEWTDGYTYRFGIIYIDYMNHLKRHPKDSAMWFAHFLVKEDEKPDDEEDTDTELE